MENDQRKKFLKYIRKIDEINIIVKYKFKRIYNKKIFFT